MITGIKIYYNINSGTQLGNKMHFPDPKENYATLTFPDAHVAHCLSHSSQMNMKAGNRCSRNQYINSLYLYSSYLLIKEHKSSNKLFMTETK